LIANWCAHRAAVPVVPVVPVVPQILLHTPVTADPRPGMFSYDMGAAFTSFQQHGSGIHVVRPERWRGQRD
jgi:hypothetical protein